LVEALAALQEQHRQTELAQSQNQAVLDATSEAMLLIAPDRQILAVNRRFEELFAVRTDELVGQSFWAFRPYVERVYADPEALFKKVAGTASDTERHFTLDLTQVWPQARDLELHSTPVRSPSGQFVGRLYAFRDVTDERELLRQKDELVSIASHELRGPLAAIVGFTELLLDQDLAPDERRQFLELMLGEGERLTAILNDFLDLQRFESGRQTIQPRPDDLCALLQQAVAAAGIDVERPIQLSVPDDLPLVFMDHDRIRQVLTNLLGNARKYSPNGGEIQVTVQARADYVDVAVQDQGLGLPPEAFAQLFQKFYRVAGRERREITGTGLGLAICKQIVEAHGGRIWAESAGAKCGSRFTFTLPMVASSNGGV
ncbi:MAG: PAS domain-containing sensor histidine kinase, partial [Chloroflexi bacterium]|nr:PAS domain-containing sensor histidine kinase [Chloroflexota bacterium]